MPCNDTNNKCHLCGKVVTAWVCTPEGALCWECYRHCKHPDDLHKAVREHWEVHTRQARQA